MDACLPYGRMPQKEDYLASPGRLAGRLSSLHVRNEIIRIHQETKLALQDKLEIVLASINQNQLRCFPTCCLYAS